MGAQVERNWSENVTYSPAALLRPGSVEELQEIVAVSARVKALGTRHSFTDAADTPGGALVSLAGLDDTVHVDHDTMTADVPGGASYGVVATQLEAAGVALANMGSLPHISVAGATATGTHGSGDTKKVLADAIQGVELVRPGGELRRIERGDPEFDAVVVGIGAFGLITRLTLFVEPSYRMRQDLYRDLSWDEVLGDFGGLMASADSVNVQGRFAHPTAAVVIRKSRDLDDAPETLFGGRRDHEDPEAGPQHTPRRGEPGPWHLRLPHFHLEHPPSAGGDELQTDYMVAREDASAAIQALRDMGDAIDPHLWGFEIRSVAGDDFWLSPAHGRDSVSIGFTWKKHVAEVTALLPEVEAALAPFAPRPHWGKLFALPPEVLVDTLPRYRDFFELVEHLDPAGVFANPFLDRLRPT
ncbi:MAG: FAD-binding protein [Actinomycetota bacterium]